ncbi:MAG: TIGR02266 family protein [Myxococcota bacterium]
MSRTERRQGARKPTRIPVAYGTVDAFFQEFASNINEGGMFIETDAPAELDELVQLEFSFPGIDGPIRVEARVAWVSDGKAERPSGMGVEFLDLDPTTRAAINAAVRKLRA